MEQLDGQHGNVAITINGEEALSSSVLGELTHTVEVPIELSELNDITIVTDPTVAQPTLVYITAEVATVANVFMEPDSIYVNANTEVHIGAFVSTSTFESVPIVVLEERLASGAYVTLGTMTDDGDTNEDSFAGDGEFSLLHSFFSAVPVTRTFRVKASDGVRTRVSSDSILTVFVPLSDSEFAAMNTVGSGSLDLYAQLEPTVGHEEAVSGVVAWLEADPIVDTVVAEGLGESLSIRFTNGRLGTVFVKTKEAPSARVDLSAAATSGQLRRSGQNATNISNSAPATGATIGNRKIYVANPTALEDGANALGVHVQGLVTQYNATHCDYFEMTLVENADFSVVEARSMLTGNLRTYGTLVLQGHANSNVFLTGESYNPNVATTRLDLQSDLAARGGLFPRLSLGYYPGANGTQYRYGITHQFVTHYPRKGRLPNSLVVLAGCKSMIPMNQPLAAAFRAVGANATVGYTEECTAWFDVTVVIPYLQRFISTRDATVQSAFVEGLCRTDRPATCFVIKVSNRAPAKVPHDCRYNPLFKTVLDEPSCPSSVVSNGNFESGSLAGWSGSASSSACVLSAYGPVLPPGITDADDPATWDNRHFTRLDFTNGFSHGGSAIVQSLDCVVGMRITSVSFDYNFIAPDLPLYCNGQDLPFIETRIVGAGLQGYVDLRTWLELECGTESAVAGLPCGDYVVGAPCGTLYQTGWKRANYPMFSGVLGEGVTFAMNVDADYGSVGYPFRATALIDNVVVELVDEEGVTSKAVLGQSPFAPGPRVMRGGATSSFNGAGFLFPDHGPATVFASEIVVESVGGGGGGDRSGEFAIDKVTVGLEGLRHTFPDDLDLILEAPSGQTIVLMSDAGGGGDVSSLTMTFDDEALALLPDDAPIESGVFIPTNHTNLFPDVFPAPAPQGPHGSSLSELDGTSPIGSWKLWAVDNARGDRGALLSGWWLAIETVNQPPVAVCQNVTVEADESCAGSASIDNGSYDPDGGSSTLSFEQSPSGPYPLGTTVVTLTVTDQSGASSQCEAEVTVVDSGIPTVSCPGGTSASVSAGCVVAIPNVLSGTSATDNCTSSGALVLTQSPAAGTMVGPGVHTITVSATDASDNTGTCTTTFTAVDAQPPAIAGPVPAIFLRTSSSAGGTTVTFPLPSASDNCTSVSVTAVPSSGTTFPNGKTLVTATATDVAGLTASTQFTVKVVRFGESIGVYIPSTAGWFLRNTNSNGAADLTFSFGPGGPGWVPIAGDWDRSGTDTPGLFYNKTAGVFLSDTNGPGGANYVFTYGPAGASWIPIAGDWNGEGVDSIGLYDPSTGNFFLKNINAAGNADVILQLGAGGSSFMPIVGDWNGDGIDTVGIYDSETGVFYLRNTNSNGPADVTFSFGAGAKGYFPISGDWDGDNVCTVGLYDPATGDFFLRNSNAPGDADIELNFGPLEEGAVPVAGSWDGQ